MGTTYWPTFASPFQTLCGTIALTGANLELDGNVAEGVLTFAADGRQTLQGTLAVDHLDLTPYLSTLRLLTAADREWSRTRLDLDGLSTVDLDLRLSAGKVTIGANKTNMMRSFSEICTSLFAWSSSVM